MSEGPTVDKMESKYGAIRDPPEVDWFALSHERISQRHKIANGGARPEVLQVRSNGSVLATSREVFKLLFSQVDLRVQLFEVSFAKPSGDSFINITGHGVLPERLIFLRGVETSDSSRTDCNTQSINRIETATWTYNV